MYFAVLGKHTTISLQEISQYEGVSGISDIYRGNIITFDYKSPSKELPLRAGSVKYGKILTTPQLQKVLEETKILGMADKQFAKKHKSDYPNIKRFKEVTLTHTDLTIKNKGTELIQLPQQKRGVVTHYQNIKVYETIDFEKPSSGMKIGMMPAKLTHILCNLSTGLSSNNTSEKTIRDPFCGFGTTNFIANAYGYNTIGSDIKIEEARRNNKRRQESEKTKAFYNPEKKLTFFKHDVTKPFTQPFLNHVTNIVSEGRLGPMISGKTREPELKNHIKKITQVYEGFFTNILSAAHLTSLESIAITLPHYIHFTGYQVEHYIQKFITKLNASSEKKRYSYEVVPQKYSRKGQKVGRTIVLLSFIS